MAAPNPPRVNRFQTLADKRSPALRPPPSALSHQPRSSVLGRQSSVPGRQSSVAGLQPPPASFRDTAYKFLSEISTRLALDHSKNANRNYAKPKEQRNPITTRQTRRPLAIHNIPDATDYTTARSTSLASQSCHDIDQEERDCSIRVTKVSHHRISLT